MKEWWILYDDYKVIITVLHVLSSLHPSILARIMKTISFFRFSEVKYLHFLFFLLLSALFTWNGQNSIPSFCDSLCAFCFFLRTISLPFFPSLFCAITREVSLLFLPFYFCFLIIAREISLFAICLLFIVVFFAITRE